MASAEAIVFAICHEVGNLLAAIRLHGQLLDEDSGAQIAELAARSGALLALVRPLLSDERPQPTAVAPRDLLQGLHPALDDPGDRRLRVDLESAADLPPVAIEGDLVHHLLLVEILAAFEDLAPGGAVGLGAERAGDAVDFVLEDATPAREPAPAPQLTGRALTVALAEHLLARRGGGVSVSAAGEGRRIRYRVPVAAG